MRTYVHVTRENWRSFSNAMHNWFLTKPGSKIGAPGSVHELGFLALEYGGAAGELLNDVKKIWRDGITSERLEHIRGEIADNMIMLHHVSEALGLNPEECAADKITELHQRWPACPQATLFASTLYKNGRITDEVL